MPAATATNRNISISQNDDGITTKNAIFLFFQKYFTNVWECNKKNAISVQKKSIRISIELSKNKRFHFTDSIRRSILYLFISFRLTSSKNISFVWSEFGAFEWYVEYRFYFQQTNGIRLFFQMHCFIFSKGTSVDQSNYSIGFIDGSVFSKCGKSQANTKWQFINIVPMLQRA